MLFRVIDITFPGALNANDSRAALVIWVEYGP